MSEDGRRKVAEALVESQFDADVQRYKNDILKKIQGEKAAEEAIYRAVEAWTGYSPDRSNRLPVVRSGELVSFLSTPLASMMLPGHEVKTIASAVGSENTPAIRSRLKGYRRLVKTLEAALIQISEMDIQDRAHIFRLAKETPKKLEEKIVVAMGSMASVSYGSNLLIAELREAISRCEEELETRASGRGRPREEARYRVAEGFAKLFAKLTGERPTFSEDENGLHGKFSPALRDLFDAIGWNSADLEGPAKAACEAVTDADLEAPENPPMGGIFGWPT